MHATKGDTLVAARPAFINLPPAHSGLGCDSCLGFDNGFDSSGFVSPTSFDLSFNSVNKSTHFVVPITLSPNLKCCKMVVLSKLCARAFAPFWVIHVRPPLLCCVTMFINCQKLALHAMVCIDTKLVLLAKTLFLFLDVGGTIGGGAVT